MSQQYPDFKPNFDYNNIGNIVGTLVYAKELVREDQTPYGYEFLINARGFGSVNVRIPMMQKAQNSLDNFPVSEKPRVRAGLSRLEQFTSEAGRTYTNATSFIELAQPTAAGGNEMPDNIAGRLAGEVFNLREENGVIKFNLVTYSVDRDDKSKRATNSQGVPVDPQVIMLEVHQPELIAQAKQLTNGANVEVGYKYLNYSKTEYDEYGFALNSGETVERVEVGKFNMKQATTPQPNQGGFGGQPQQQSNPFGGFGNQTPPPQQQPQQGFGGNQQQGFGQQQQSAPERGFGQQQSPPNDPFAGQGQQVPQNDPFAQQAQQMFGGQPPQQGGFGFGN